MLWQFKSKHVIQNGESRFQQQFCLLVWTIVVTIVFADENNLFSRTGLCESIPSDDT